MDEIPWYSDASLVAPSHVYCVGSLAQCVRKWTRLAETERASTYIRLAETFEGRQRLDAEQVAVLAAHPELRKV
jgi:hypothetical protein